MKLAEAKAVAEQVVQRLAPFVTRAEIAGSVRRKKEHVKDIEIVAVPVAVPDGLFGETRPGSEEIREVAATWGHIAKAGLKYIQVEDVMGSGVTLDLFLVTAPASWGALYAIRTGPADFSQMLVTRLRGRLHSCVAGRVIGPLGEEVPTPTEESFFAACGVEWLAPEERA